MVNVMNNNINKNSNLFEIQSDSKPKLSVKLTGANGLRAIACLAVITHHITQQIMMNVQPLWIQKIQALALMGNTGVSIFFILSGFLLSYPFWKNYLNGGSYPNLKVYALKRAARIIPGFYISLIVSFLIVLFYNIPVNYLWSRLVAGLTFTAGFNYITFFPSEINGPLWSISFEVFSYFLMPIFMYVLFKLSWKRRSFLKSFLYWIGILVLIILINQLVHIFFTPTSINRGWEYGLIGGAKYWMPNYNPIGFFGHFSFGIMAAGITTVLYKNSVKLLKFKQAYVFDIIGFITFISSFLLLWFMKDVPEFGFSIQHQPYFFPFYQLLIASTLAVLPHTNFIGKILDNRFFNYTANISFGLYFWHYIFIYIVTNSLVKKYQFMGMANLKDWFIISACIIIAAYFTATLSYKFIEMPIVRWARKEILIIGLYLNTEVIELSNLI